MAGSFKRPSEAAGRGKKEVEFALYGFEGREGGGLTPRADPRLSGTMEASRLAAGFLGPKSYE
jgi:hypothetical protein